MKRFQVAPTRDRTKDRFGSNHAIHRQHLDRQVRVVKPTFNDAAAAGGGLSSEC
jgi:hypothetical protein